MTNELNQKEIELLRTIKNDKFAVGPFSGMVANRFPFEIDPNLVTDEDIKAHLKLVLRVRLLIEDIVK